MPDGWVLERGQAIDEEIVADETAADGAMGRTSGHLDVGELLNGGSNGLHVVLVVVSLGRLALDERRTLNEVHDDIPMLSALEAKVNVGDAEDARMLGLHDLCNLSLSSNFSPDEGVLAVFDPESRLACDPHADPVPVDTSFSARIYDVVVCWEVSGCWEGR